MSCHVCGNPQTYWMYPSHGDQLVEVCSIKCRRELERQRKAMRREVRQIRVCRRLVAQLQEASEKVDMEELAKIRDRAQRLIRHQERP